MRCRVAIVLPFLALAACGQPSEDAAAPEPDGATAAQPEPSEAAVPAETAAAAAPAPTAFAQCKTCHQVVPGKHGIGPSLAGVYGTKAGEIPGYAFSAAMKASGLTWDDATLDRYLESPMKTVPGTKMVYPGVKDPAKRAEIIAYMKTL
ncbi:Cytochrome c2 iso-2 [Tsuneonella dongtanensis]|uniref:Cytochrome c2 iso-2 n=1 Tax=Tsuneonella dongtanensis TaxID=692370 RepID=A0A1B2A987_9SPHN|nr:c-type cytochrome [Tsuneonella dongtanensis]ANY18716.1 Cytochrome c2 iso-2 [Tsuneonella dongtanensis]